MINLFSAPHRSVYCFNQAPADGENFFKCSTLKVRFSNTLKYDDGEKFGKGFHRVKCTETFATAEELFVHQFLHHKDWVVRRVDVTRDTSCTQIIKDRIPEGGFPVLERNATWKAGKEIPGGKRRYYEDRLCLCCRTCPHTVDLIRVLHNNYAYIAGHLPISARLSYDMLKNLILPLFDVTKKDLHPNARDNVGKMVAMIFQAPVSAQIF